MDDTTKQNDTDRLYERIISASTLSIKDRVGKTIACIIKLAKYRSLNEILAIPIGAHVVRTFQWTSIEWNGKDFAVPTPLWDNAELVHLCNRLESLRRCGTYPTTGPFFL